MGVFAL